MYLYHSFFIRSVGTFGLFLLSKNSCLNKITKKYSRGKFKLYQSQKLSLLRTAAFITITMI
jgi:hypothetical protein